MTKEETVKRLEENLKVAQAWAEGAQVEFWIPNSIENGWVPVQSPSFDPSLVYRIKPEPPKPREWWVNVYAENSAMHTTKEYAESAAFSSRLECILVREVMPKEPS